MKIKSGFLIIYLVKKIKSHEDLNCVPENEFFSKTEFYSSLENAIISYEEHENIKKFWQILRLKKFPTCTIFITFKTRSYFENRAKEMTGKFPYNPRKCTSDSSLIGYIHQYLSKVIILLPTQAEIVDLFQKSLIGAFSCINTRLLFDLKILLPINSQYQPKEKLKFIY